MTIAVERDNMVNEFATIQLGTLISLVLRYFFGECDFSQLPTTGPYDVGFTEFFSEKYSNHPPGTKFLLKPYLKAKVPIIQIAELATDFKLG